VAAYFAASGAAEAGSGEFDISVWALMRMVVEFEELVAPRQEGYTRLPVKMIRAPAADNPNLQAQRGLFLVHQEFAVDLEEEFRPEAYDQLLVSNLDFFASLRRSRTPFPFKLSLPASEAPELLRILAGHGIDAGSIFPGLAGAAKAVGELRLWPDPAQWSRELADAHLSERMKLARRALASPN
jgi:hypothetical protein